MRRFVALAPLGLFDLVLSHGRLLLFLEFWVVDEVRGRLLAPCLVGLWVRPPALLVHGLFLGDLLLGLFVVGRGSRTLLVEVIRPVRILLLLAIFSGFLRWLIFCLIVANSLWRSLAL